MILKQLLGFRDRDREQEQKYRTKTKTMWSITIRTSSFFSLCLCLLLFTQLPVHYSYNLPTSSQDQKIVDITNGSIDDNPKKSIISKINLIGTVPYNGYDFFRLPFTIIEGTKEIEILHAEIKDDKNILDFGLEDYKGEYRGWGGGNKENIVINEYEASRSYIPGRLYDSNKCNCNNNNDNNKGNCDSNSTWNVVIGKASMYNPPARYNVTILLKDKISLYPPDPSGKGKWASNNSDVRHVYPTDGSYLPKDPMAKENKWYAGDFHVHSRESGDAHPSVNEIREYANQIGLDFVAITDHNVISSLDYFQSSYESNIENRVLLIPGMEYTTYHGHANVIGSTKYVNHTVNMNEISTMVKEFHAQGENIIFSINHEDLDYSIIKECIGCKWEYIRQLPMNMVDAMEIGIGSWSSGEGALFDLPAIKWWDNICNTGYMITPLGGSDDHKGGNETEIKHTKHSFTSPIGAPTTYVHAKELSVPGILHGIKAGKTVVKLNGQQDPFIYFETNPKIESDKPIIRVHGTSVIDPNSKSQNKNENLGDKTNENLISYQYNFEMTIHILHDFENRNKNKKTLFEKKNKQILRNIDSTKKYKNEINKKIEEEEEEGKKTNKQEEGIDIKDTSFSEDLHRYELQILRNGLVYDNKVIKGSQLPLTWTEMINATSTICNLTNPASPPIDRWRIELHKFILPEMNEDISKTTTRKLMPLTITNNIYVVVS